MSELVLVIRENEPRLTSLAQSRSKLASTEAAWAMPTSEAPAGLVAPSLLPPLPGRSSTQASPGTQPRRAVHLWVVPSVRAEEKVVVASGRPAPPVRERGSPRTSAPADGFTRAIPSRGCRTLAGE